MLFEILHRKKNIKWDKLDSIVEFVVKVLEFLVRTKLIYLVLLTRLRVTFKIEEINRKF